MATHVLAEVLEHSAADGGDLLVIIVLADQAGRETREAHCSIGLISKLTKRSERAVQYSLRNLSILGEVSVVGSAIGGRTRGNIYRINRLPIKKGADSAPFSWEASGEKGADSAPFSQPERVQTGAEKGANGGMERVQTGADSLFRSFIPYVPTTTTLSSNATRGSMATPAVAKQILHELNRRTFRKNGRGYPPTDANVKLILARIRETDVDTVRQVTVRKILEWWGTEMQQYVRPLTLYGQQKFSQYAGEIGTKLRRRDGLKLSDAFTREQLELITAPFPEDP